METAATDIGSRIRQAREQRGLTLRDVANATEISMTALNAIERNDFDRLPGGVFSRAYVRAFAAEVGLNADEFAREYRTSFEAESLPTPHRPHEAGADQSARTTGPCWIAAVADGDRVLYRLMQAGERALIQAHRNCVSCRRRRYVVYSINGATGRPLGRNGEVVTVRITNDNLGRLFVEPASAIPRKGAATTPRPRSR